MRNGKQSDKATVRYEAPEMPWQREIERFLERAWIPWAATRRWRRPWMPDDWMPDVDVFEHEGNLVVRADLPGVKREDIQVSVEGERLVVHGHRQEEKKVEEEDYHHSERRMGSFTRTLALPDGFDPAAIKATYKDSVLQVTVPKPTAPELATTTIEIN
jgi:HSP20 family protein